MSLADCQYHHGGVLLPSVGLWLDGQEPQQGAERVFISHAHSDHIAPHREVILSEATGNLMAARLPGERIEHRLPWRRPAEFVHAGQPWRITLLPAGHVLGSAMALIEAGGESLLYSGDFKLRLGLSCEPCQPVPADTLIMETTFGRPQYQFPPTESVIAGVVRFCREALGNDETPVLLGYSLGKSQEILRGLAEAELPVSLHPQVARITRIYEQCGQRFPPYEVAEGSAAKGRVLLCPPGINVARLRLGPTRSAVLTGWAIDPGCRFRYQTDAAFPLSDHADYADLIEFVRRVHPRRILTLHGFAADFAASLRALGWDARALGTDEQMVLGLPPDASHERTGRPGKESPSASLPHRRSKPSPSGDGSFSMFAATCSAIASTASKLEKVERLAAFMRELPDPSLPIAAAWFSGRVQNTGTQGPLQINASAIREAVCQATGATQDEFSTTYHRHSDLGEAVHDLVTASGNPGASPSIPQVAAALSELGVVRGPSEKVPRLVNLLGLCGPNEARYLTKILTGDLRIGLKEGLVEDALASAFGVSPEAIRRAHLLTGDIGHTATAARDGTLGTLTLEPFRPVRVMLATPEPTAEAVWKRVAEWDKPTATELPADGTISEQPVEFRAEPGSESPSPAWIEDKYDGIRCQLHKVGSRVALYSRDLKDVTDAFADVANAARQLPFDVVLDGEIVGMRGDRALPFAELQRRLGRREADLFLGGEIPVKFIAFDLLWLNGTVWMDAPLNERRGKLEALQPLPSEIELARVARVTNADDVEASFREARLRGNEGLMIKSPSSAYLPGRRGSAWLKLKKPGATLDCIVVGVEYGHGKRNGMLSDYTFAVRDAETGDLLTIGKAYSGLTDREIQELTAYFLQRVVRKRGRYCEVVPEVVIEVAFDRLQPSPRHTSGLAMRFPRIVQIRHDKPPGEIDTVQEARRLASLMAR